MRLIAVKGGIETGDLRHLWCDRRNRADRRQGVRLMQRREGHQSFERGRDLSLDQDRFGVGGSTMHDPMAHAVEHRLMSNMSNKPIMDGGNGGSVIGSGYRLIQQLAALRIGDLEVRLSSDRGNLAMRASREGAVRCGLEHRELDA